MACGLLPYYTFNTREGRSLSETADGKVVSGVELGRL